MELEYKFLFNQSIKQPLNSLFNAKFNGSTVLNIRRIQVQLEKEFKEFQDGFKEVAKKYAELDEKGEFKIDAKVPYGVVLKEGKLADLQKEEQEMMSEKFELVGCKKIHISNITSCRDFEFSAVDLMALEPLLDGLDVV